jgi:hypothetical protein
MGARLPIRCVPCDCIQLVLGSVSLSVSATELNKGAGLRLRAVRMFRRLVGRCLGPSFARSSVVARRMSRGRVIATGFAESLAAALRSLGSAQTRG